VIKAGKFSSYQQRFSVKIHSTMVENQYLLFQDFTLSLYDVYSKRQINKKKLSSKKLKREKFYYSCFVRLSTHPWLDITAA
jgi:hypothetical protein